MNDQLLYGVAAVPVIVGLVQALKTAGLPDRFAPLTALAIGVAAALVQKYAIHISWIQAIITGTTLGLSAVGLHAGTKATAQKGTTQPQTDGTDGPTPPRTFAKGSGRTAPPPSKANPRVVPIPGARTQPDNGAPPGSPTTRIHTPWNDPPQTEG